MFVEGDLEVLSIAIRGRMGALLPGRHHNRVLCNPCRNFIPVLASSAKQSMVTSERKPDGFALACLQ
jgi:hypothetical protein